MTSSHSDDLQSLHGIASDSGYTSAASTASDSRKRAPSLTSVHSSRSRSTSSSRRGVSLNAKFDRLNASMNDVAAASTTSAGAGTSLGIQRKTITKSGERTRGSMQRSASMRRNNAAEVEMEAEPWKEDEAGKTARRKRRRIDEVFSGPGSSLGAIGEAFRLLKWDDRRGLRGAVGDGETLLEGGYDQYEHLQLTRGASPTGSGRVRTVAREAGWSPSQPDCSPMPMALPPWMVDEKPGTAPRTFSPPPEWLARVMAPQAPRRPPSPSPSPPILKQNPSQTDQLPQIPEPLPFPYASPPNSHFTHSEPPPYRHQSAFMPAPYSTNGRMESFFPPESSDHGPLSQQPIYEAQLTRASSAMNVGRHGELLAGATGWNALSEMGSDRGSLGSEQHFGQVRQQHLLARPPSPPPPISRPSPLYTSQIHSLPAPCDASYRRHPLAPGSHPFDYSSTTALLRANGWQSPSQALKYSICDRERVLEPLATSSDPREETTHDLGNFWKRPPRPANMDDVQLLCQAPIRDRYAESLLQSAIAPEILTPRFPPPPQDVSSPLSQLAQPSTNQAFVPQLFEQPSSIEQPSSTPRKQQPIAEHPPPISCKSSSSATRTALLLVSQPHPQKKVLVPPPLIIKPALPFPDPFPPPPTRQRSFPRPDPVFRPSTAPNLPTSPFLREEYEQDNSEREGEVQLAGMTGNLRSIHPAAEATTDTHLFPSPPDASPTRAPLLTTQETNAEHLGGETGEVREEDDEFESRSTDGDSIFPPLLGGTTAATRIDEEKEIWPHEEEEDLEKEFGEEEEGGEEGLLAGANFSIFEDPEDPIQRFTQE